MADLEQLPPNSPLNPGTPPQLPGPLAPDDAARPIEAEIAVAWRNFFNPTFNGLLRSEDATLLTRGGGKSYQIYDELERDPHCYAVLMKRKMALISRDWELEPGGKAPLDQQAAELVQQQLDALSFDRICLDLLDAILKGYSVGETMWGVAGNRIIVQDVLARDQRRFTFAADSSLRFLSPANMVMGEALPERKFIVHRFGSKTGNPFGRGLGEKLFWPVFFKRQTTQFWLTFLDKFGSPTAVGKYNALSTTGKARETLLEALQAISNEAFIAVPQGMEVTLLEAARSANTGYEDFCRYMDDEMSKCVLGETMSTTSKSAGLGSSQANVHNEVRLEITAADADLLAGVLNATLLTWITEYNLPGAKPPRIWWDCKPAEDLASRSEVDSKVFAMGFEPSEEYIQSTYGEGWTKKVAPPPARGALAPPAPGDGAANFAEAADEPSPTSAQADVLAQEADKTIAQWRDELRKLVAEATSLEDLRDRVTDAYPQMNLSGLSKAMQGAMAAAQLAGRFDILEG